MERVSPEEYDKWINEAEGARKSYVDWLEKILPKVEFFESEGLYHPNIPLSDIRSVLEGNMVYGKEDAEYLFYDLPIDIQNIETEQGITGKAGKVSYRLHNLKGWVFGVPDDRSKFGPPEGMTEEDFSSVVRIYDDLLGIFSGEVFEVGAAGLEEINFEGNDVPRLTIKIPSNYIWYADDILEIQALKPYNFRIVAAEDHGATVGNRGETLQDYIDALQDINRGFPNIIRLFGKDPKLDIFIELNVGYEYS